MTEPPRPLQGVTVLAWEQVVSLPTGTQLLADLGATVIRLEMAARVGNRPRHASNDRARGKLSIAVDLRKEEGRQLFRELVRVSDVVCENFTPRVKREFDLTYDRLKSIREDLVMLSLSGYGQTGRWSERPTYGPGIEAASGHALSMGYPDAPPTRPGTLVYADTISGYYAAFAMLAALQLRRLTGRGQYIDLSMYEANVYHLGLSIARSSVTGKPESRRGNADPATAVQGVFRCRKPEEWLAVTIRQWQLEDAAALLGCPPDAPSVEGSLSAWAVRRDANEAAERLQQAGVAAGPVLNARDVFWNAQLRHRTFFTLVEHDRLINGYRAHWHASSPWQFVGTMRPAGPEAPAVGEDTEEVLRRFVGLANEDLAALAEKGVISWSRPEHHPISVMVSEEDAQRRLELRAIAGYDPDPGRTLGLPTGQAR